MELRIKPKTHTDSTPSPALDVDSIMFRWGRLLFVCQQMRGDHIAVESSNASVTGGEDGTSVLSSYNLSTPPNDELKRLHAAVPADTANAHPYRDYSIASSAHTSGRSTARPSPSYSMMPHASPPMAAVSSAANGMPIQPVSSSAAAISEARPFSLPRAPASIVANLPTRPAFTLTPPESVPPRRQSSYTLPPQKNFEERRFSYPIQALNGDRRPPPAGSALGSMAHGAGAGAGAVAKGSPGMLPSPGTRTLDMRQRMGAAAAAGSFRMGIAAKGIGAGTSNQPTPSASPLGTISQQHTPVVMSPAPMSSAGHAGYVQVNVYPPPQASAQQDSGE
ncbi:hypothetical protein EC988_007536, partial [Linderina pennispora]